MTLGAFQRQLSCPRIRSIPSFKNSELWRSDLSKTNKKAASALADPAESKNLFPDFDLSLHTESHFRTNTSLKLAFSFQKRDDEDLSGIPYNTSSVKFNDDIQNVEALQNAGDAHEDFHYHMKPKLQQN